MLTSVILKNYTTFIEKTIFDFQATNYKILESTNVGNNRILKGALFVGENASGKTEFLSSIVLLLDILLDNSELNFQIKKSLYTAEAKYSISYTFNVDCNIIKYDITFENNNIYSEKLFVNNELKLNRLNQNGQTYFDDEKDIENINLNLSLVKLEYYNTKFNNDSVLNKWFDFLKNSMYVNCLHGQTKSYNPSRMNEQTLSKYTETNDESEINNVMTKIGYNSEVIFDKKKVKMDGSVQLYPKDVVLFRKKGTKVAIPLFMESAGNNSLINVLIPIMFAIKNNCMLIIDEFSSGLHNELEEALVKYFFNNSCNSQLFFTSHSTNLLDTDILRPDQIYSFKFDSKKGTIIKRFSDENPRESQNIEKMYLNGVFDGMPNYDKEFKD